MIEQLLQADRELTVDRVDRAEAIYRSVSEADPNNAIAVTGLARCALARGDDRGAHDLATRALTIDPEDDVARRLEARMAEVLATRGEPVSRPAAADGERRDAPASTDTGHDSNRGLVSRLLGR